MAKPIVLQKLETLEGGVTALQRDALQYKGHFNGDLNTIGGSDKVGIYALQHQCINTPNDTDKYVFERAILTVKSDGVATTQELTATHIGYPTYVGKHYKRTGWSGSGWQPWKCNEDKIAALQTGKADKNPTGYSPSIVSIGGLGTINTRDNSTDTPPISDGWGTFLSSGGLRDFQIGYKWNDSMARLWYRVHKGDAEYRDWKELATTDKIDISSKLVGGWQVLDANCSVEATIVGGVLFVNGLIKNNSESSTCLDLSQYPPKDGKWHGGSAVGGNGNAKYFVIDPQGSAQFQAGYEKGVAYTLNFNYRVY